MEPATSNPSTVEQCVIWDIISVLNIPGEDMTDGECIDAIIGVFTKYGYKVFGGTAHESV